MLVPGGQRDFLLQLAAEGAYAPLWGSGILVELDYVLTRLDAQRGRPDSAANRARLFATMARAFPGATIDSPKDRAYPYWLSDPDDGRVVHAAITGKADALVTDDSRAGFSTSADLDAAQIEVVTARQFAANTVAAHPNAGLRTLHEMAARLTSPPRSPAEVLDNLHQRYGMSEVATILTPLLTRQRSS